MQVRTSHIGGRVHLWGATIENQPGTALRLSRTEISADMFCDSMTVAGKVRVAGARIGGRLHLGQVRLVNPDGVALDAAGLQAAEVVLLPATPNQGIVRLGHARIGLLRDDPAC